jgi:drug/metabolite transporter (DMT)-like permease
MSAAPLLYRLQTNLAAQTASTTNDQLVGEAPFDGVVTSVSYTPKAAITGATATARTFTLINKGQTGVGTTVVATLSYTTGVNGVAFDEQAFTLSVVAGATAVAAGDILEVSETVASTGTANPGGLIQLELNRS